MQTLTTVYILTSLLLIIIAIPMAFRWIKPNPIYGFRVKKTLQDPKIWYEVNAYSGRIMIVTGVIDLILTIGLSMMPRVPVDLYASILAVIFLVTITIMMVMTFRYMRTL